MRITTCLTSAMVPLQPSGSAAAAAALRPAAARGPPLQPAVTAAAAPSPVYCRNRRRLRPGANPWPACRDDPLAPGPCACDSSALLIPGSDGSGQAPGPLTAQQEDNQHDDHDEHDGSDTDIHRGVPF